MQRINMDIYEKTQSKRNISLTRLEMFCDVNIHLYSGLDPESNSSRNPLDLADEKQVDDLQLLLERHQTSHRFKAFYVKCSIQEACQVSTTSIHHFIRHFKQIRQMKYWAIGFALNFKLVSYLTGRSQTGKQNTVNVSRMLNVLTRCDRPKAKLTARKSSKLV